MKQITLFFFALMLTATTAFAQYSWQIGSPNVYDVTATLNSGTLTFRGTGAVRDFVSETDAPWYTLRSNITNLVIEEGITTIGNYAFRNSTALKSISFPESLTSIRAMTFYDCSGLTSISLPKNLTIIGWFAFGRCTGLKSVYNYALTPQDIDYGIMSVFSELTLRNITLHVSPASLNLYRNAAVWKEFDIVGLTGINDISADDEEAIVVGYYSLTGVKLPQVPEKGAYVVVYSNGKAGKIIRKV